jgi:MoxR-like ATPase
VIGVEELEQLRQAARGVYVDPLLQRWIVDLVRATREDDAVSNGASVRGSLGLERTARAWALLDGREFVVPEDVERLFAPVLLHRITFTPAFLAEVRSTGWESAAEGFQEACLLRAPRPVLDRYPS